MKATAMSNRATKAEVLSALAAIDAAGVVMAANFQIVAAALNDRIRASHQTGEANSPVGGPDLALASTISVDRFARAVALRLAGLGLAAVVANPVIARGTKGKHPRHAGEGFLDTWTARVERFLE
jgi:hypothetical protein